MKSTIDLQQNLIKAGQIPQFFSLANINEVEIVWSLAPWLHIGNAILEITSTDKVVLLVWVFVICRYLNTGKNGSYFASDAKQVRNE